MFLSGSLLSNMSISNLNTMTKELSNLKKQVMDSGLNIYALVGRLTKLRGNPIPDSVVELLCVEYLKRKEKVEKPFAWALTVLQLKADEINAKREMDRKKVYSETNTKLLKDLFR